MRVFIMVLLLMFQYLSAISQELPVVKMQTSLGDIIVEVDTINAPVTAKNFLKHIATDSFKEAVFYRVVRHNNQPDNSVQIEVIQGGLFYDEKIEQHDGIKHETTRATGLKHLDGTISMARNEPGTASTEFFICIGNQPGLDYGGKRNPDGKGFAAFGRVLEGMELVREIQQLPDDHQYLKEPLKIVMSIKKE